MPRSTPPWSRSWPSWTDGVSVGTGVIFTEDGYVLTNFHVVEDGTSCTVGLYTGKTYDAKYVAGDQENDIAVLKVEPQSPPAGGGVRRLRRPGRGRPGLRHRQPPAAGTAGHLHRRHRLRHQPQCAPSTARP